MHARFEFETGERAFSFAEKYNLPEAAKLCLGRGGDTDRKTDRLRVHTVHPEQVGGKQCSLLSAGAGAYLHDHATVIVRIARNQQSAQCRFRFRQLFLHRQRLLGGKRPQLRIG